MRHQKAPSAWSVHQGAALFEALTLFGKIDREPKPSGSGEKYLPAGNRKDAFALAKISAAIGCITVGISLFCLL